MLVIFEWLCLPLLLLLVSAWAVSSSWRARGMTFHRLWARSPLPPSAPSSASSLSPAPNDKGPMRPPCKSPDPFVVGRPALEPSPPII